jgi:hypothetical protein
MYLYFMKRRKIKQRKEPFYMRPGFRKFVPTLKSRFCIGVGKDFTRRLLSEVGEDIEKVFVV